MISIDERLNSQKLKTKLYFRRCIQNIFNTVIVLMCHVKKCEQFVRDNGTIWASNSISNSNYIADRSWKPIDIFFGLEIRESIS